MTDAESWAGRRVIVTGGASGLGRATAAPDTPERQL
jgi:NADP-dependent 3-hydroxy acid dehydrogenase YdfG